MKRSGDDIHNSNPGEEMNFHGLPNDTSSDQYGRNYGYPGCVAIYDPGNVKDFSVQGGPKGGPKVGLQMTGDHMSGYTDDWCRDNATAPRITFSSHLAPLDIKFLDDGSAALIAIHGSWYVLRSPGLSPQNFAVLDRYTLTNQNVGTASPPTATGSAA